MPNGPHKIERIGELSLVASDEMATVMIEAPTLFDGKVQSTASVQFMLSETGLAEADANKAVIALVFPLPTKPLLVGESDTKTVTIPSDDSFPEMGQVSGPMVLTYVGSTEKCAQLDGRLRIDAKRGHLATKISVDAKYCVDLTDASLVSSHLVIEMESTSDKPDDSWSFKSTGTTTLDRK